MLGGKYGTKCVGVLGEELGFLSERVLLDKVGNGSGPGPLKPGS